jgi:FAD/FMN-containing dehydrogenase
MTSLTDRDDADYEQRRRETVWNELVPERRPAAIARPSRRSEVAGLVRQAAEDDRRVAIKSGGHNWFGTFLRDDSLLIDLGGLAAVEVDVDRRVATVEPGATHKVLADALVPHGLAFPIGHCPSVGLGGYLLAGGMGWNLGEWGPGAWNVVGADVVLPDGSETFVDETTDRELFWALRGASSGFPGVVTRFHLRLFRLPEIRSRLVAFPVDLLPRLLPWASARLAQLGAGLEISLIARPANPARDRRALVAVVATGFAGDDAGARALVDRGLAGLEELGEPAVDLGTASLALNDLEGEGGWDEGLRYAADTCWLSTDYAEVGEVVARAAASSPSPLSRIVLAFGHMPADRPDVAFTGFGDLTVNIYGTWEHADDDGANVAWVQEHMDALAPLIEGHYIGETDLSAVPARLRMAYPADKWERLQAVVAATDPQRRFHSFLGED